MRRTLVSTLCILSCGVVGLATSSAAFAMPPPHHPAPMHHSGPHHHHHGGSSWVAPFVAGAILAGTLAVVHNTQKARSITQTSTEQCTSKPSNTLFWCEGEKGYYPQVRACPTGWTAIPSKQ